MNRTKINGDLKNKLISLRAACWTSFDDALDKAVDYFKAAPKNKNNLLLFLFNGIPNVEGDGNREKSVSIIPKDNQASPRNCTSEFALLATLGVVQIVNGIYYG